MKRNLSLLLIISLLWLYIPGVVMARPVEDLPVWAQVEVTGSLADLGLPVYAHLQDAAGQDYVLVLATKAQLRVQLLEQGVPYQVIGVWKRGRGAAPRLPGSLASLSSDYFLGLCRHAEARTRALESVDVVYDDGWNFMVWGTPVQMESVTALGCEVAWLPETPLILAPPRAPVQVREFTPSSLIGTMIEQVDAATVYTYTGQLSGEWPALVGGIPYTITTRHTNSGEPLEKATQFVYEHLEALGIDAGFQTWARSGYANRNVVGVITGTTYPDEIVLITAHIDDLPLGTVAPGADDNGSGVVAVMVAADIFSHYEFERTVRFVFFTGEEQGLLGSAAYAAGVAAAGETIVAVYNMDMIAWDAVDGPTLRLHTRLSSDPGYAGDLAIASTFTNVVNTYGMSDVLIPIIDADAIWASDHSPFWNKGYHAILAIEDDNDDFNDYYHTVGDTLAELNMAYYVNYVKASVGTVAHLASPWLEMGVLAGEVLDAVTSTPLAGAWVTVTQLLASSSATTGVEGKYRLKLPAGTYTVTAAACGYLPVTAPDVKVTAGLTTMRAFTLSVARPRGVTGTVKAAEGWPLYARVVMTGDPFTPSGKEVWTDPVTGVYSLTFYGGCAYTLTVDAWTPGYGTTTYRVGASDDTTQVDVVLKANKTLCTAPGYHRAPSEDDCRLSAGGLIVGHIYDASTGDPLIGAKIMNDSGESTVSRPTADPALEDGFYTLFSPASPHTFTGTLENYSVVTVTADVVQSDTMRLDLWLPVSPVMYPIFLPLIIQNTFS
ncbi:MAG: M20/M25/M40 family metallo-hydrolase [Anaerolineae bacterium]|nr:M20/M25/M40 family metallo-hydrolase [Anaerolineae bacterium]